jgi:hypothetical protein
MQNVRTTAGETFTSDEHKQLARLVFKRFGNDRTAATIAWRRLFQNSTTEWDFQKLIDGTPLTLLDAVQVPGAEVEWDDHRGKPFSGVVEGPSNNTAYVRVTDSHNTKWDVHCCALRLKS